MKKFIAYFDFLGFKEFLLRNSEQQLRQRAPHLLRDIELSLSQEKTMRSARGRVADLSGVTINCLNISDTVIFWTMDDSVESCIELLNVSYLFNWKEVLFNFPIRGCVIYDNFEMITGKAFNPKGAQYSPNLMFGKGLYNAHEKVELLNWAGTVIDNSVMEKMFSEEKFQEFLQEKTIEYKVPYKGFYKKEYAMRLTRNELNEESFINEVRNITRVFEQDNKTITSGVEEKIKNTIDFLRIFKKAKE